MSKLKKKKAKVVEEEGHKRRGTTLKRKQERKLKRETKKQEKKIFYEKKFKKKKEVEVQAPSQEELAEIKKKRKIQFDLEDLKRKEKKKKKLEKHQKEQRKQQLLLANQAEEKTIRRLEKQLGLKKRKSKNLPKSFQDDGLDIFLGGEGTEEISDLEEEGSDTLEAPRLKDVASDDDDCDEDVVDDEEMDEDDGDNEEGCDDDEMLALEGEELDEEETEDGQAEPNDEDNSVDDAEEEKVDDGDGTWEDIYGRTRGKDGSIIKTGAVEGAPGDAEGGSVPTSGKYIPPALRKSAEKSDKKKELERLAKQLKGNLNRLAESNMHSIVVQIENMYRNNSRNDMNQTLYDLIYQAVVAPALTPERLVMEYCMLISILHANIGSEVGAHFLEEFVKQFSKLYSSTDLTGDSGKELDNILLLLAYIFNFRIVSSKFLFELLNKLADSFQTKDVELVLLALRSAGFVLRKDDPTEMKNLIIKIQNKASTSTGGDNNVRVKFMLDILLAVKNNNVNKIPNYDPSHFDHLKKTLKSFIREGNFVTELKIGLKDLEEAETRGRWWIVGSFFAGNLAGEKSSSGGEPGTKTEEEFSQKLLKLARKMRMNTDARRNIFCLIMSSEDYIEATQRLLKLGTKNQTERDVMFVLLDCSLQENTFNPFYSHVAIKLSSMERKYKIANQFAVWDKIKLTSQLKADQLANLGKYISHLIRERSQSIAILRVVEFAELIKPNVQLLRTVLCEILLLDKLDDVNSIFQAVASAENLNLYREGLKLFLRHFLLKQRSKLDPGINFDKLEERVRSAEISLRTPGSSLKL